MITVYPNLSKLIELHNEARNSGWLSKAKPLERHEDLMIYAQKWADHMAKTSLLTHSNMKDIMRLGFSGAAENIAYGQETEDGVMRTWMRSYGHKRNIMNKSMTHIGCGFSYSSKDVIYWCVCFGKLK